MANLFLNSPLFIYSSFFFLLVNISDGKIHDSHAKKSNFITNTQNCKTYLEQVNNIISNDPDGIINEDQIDDYEDCLEKVQPALDYKNNIYDYYFLLECYTNLMDYYDITLDGDEADEALEGIEDEICEISE
jgi:hypothetical protein